MKRRILLTVILGTALTAAGLVGCSQAPQTYKDAQGVEHTSMNYHGGELRVESLPGMSNSVVSYTGRDGKTHTEYVHNYIGRKVNPQDSQ